MTQPSKFLLEIDPGMAIKISLTLLVHKLMSHKIYPLRLLYQKSLKGKQKQGMNRSWLKDIISCEAFVPMRKVPGLIPSRNLES